MSNIVAIRMSAYSMQAPTSAISFPIAGGQGPLTYCRQIPPSYIILNRDTHCIRSHTKLERKEEEDDKKEMGEEGEEI